MRTQRARLIVAAILLPTLWAAAADRGRAPAATPPWENWKSLRFEARRLLFFFGRVEMRLGEREGRLLLETNTRAKFMGADLARSRTRSTIDAATGRTLEYYELSPKRGKLYRFGEDGYTVQRIEPVNGYEAPIERWKPGTEEQFAYPEAGPCGDVPIVYDYYGMILHLRDSDLRRLGDEITVQVATADGPVPYRLRIGDVRETVRKLRDVSAGRTARFPVREFRVRITPADPAASDEGFLAMEGDTEIWIEADTRTLFEIEGKIPKIPGRVRVELASIGY